MLDLVDDDEAAQVAQSNQGLGELRCDLWILEVEPLQRIAGDEASRERCLADLAGAYQGDRGAAAKRLANGGGQRGPINHAANVTWKFPLSIREFQCISRTGSAAFRHAVFSCGAANSASISRRSL